MCRSFFLKVSSGIPSISARDFTRLHAACALDGTFFGRAFRNARSHGAADGSQLALELAHSRFARVGANDFANRRVGESNLLRAKAVFGDLPRNQIILRN